MSKLGDICSIQMGQSPESSTYNTEGCGLPFFQGNADFGKKNPTVRIWCNEPKKIAKPQDILISVRAPIGALNVADVECCIGRGLASITVDKGKCIDEFLWYVLKSKIDYLISMGTGSTFKAIGKSVLYDLDIPLPPLETQHQIAATLDKVTHIIDLCNAILEKLDLLVKSRFVEMFGDPIDNPMNWKIETLSDICIKLTDGTHFSPESFLEGDYKYITAKNIKEDGFDFTNLTYVNSNVHNEIYARCNPEYGDVLYIKDGVTTGIAMINTLYEQFTMLSSVALLKHNRKKINNYYLISVLNNKHMYDNIRNNMGGAAITRLTLSKICVINIPVPPLELQQQFASFVEQTDKSKLAVKQVLQKAETLKKALMQEYFG